MSNVEMIFITPKDIIKLTPKSLSAAYKQYTTIAVCLGKKKKPNGHYQKISLKEFCDFEGVDQNYALSILKIN